MLLVRMAKLIIALCFLFAGSVFGEILNKTCVDVDIDFGLHINIYKDSCPEAQSIIFSGVRSAVFQDSRMAASLVRLHFHDCFVNASVYYPSVNIDNM